MEVSSIPILGDERPPEKENERGQIPLKVDNSSRTEEVGKKQGEQLNARAETTKENQERNMKNKRELSPDERDNGNNIKNPNLSGPAAPRYPSRDYFYPSSNSGSYCTSVYSSSNENIGGYNTSRTAQRLQQAGVEIEQIEAMGRYGVKVYFRQPV